MQNILEIRSDLLLKIQNIRARMALLLLQEYVNGAIIQWGRINILNRYLNKMTSKMMKGELLKNNSFWRKHKMLFLEVHYYFICGDKINKLFQSFCSHEKSANLRILKRKHLRKLKPFKEARDGIEHIDNLIRQNNNDFGNIIKDKYSIGGKQYDISKKGLDSMVDLFSDIISYLQSK